MATDVVMPKLGLTMERGTIAAWLKAEGDSVRKGEPLLEVETDKVTMEVEAQVEGIVGRILVAAGEEVDIATPIAIISAPGEAIPSLSQDIGSSSGQVVLSESPPAHRLTQELDAVSDAAEPAPASQERPRHRASPKARKIAAEKGLDLATVAGSGPGGRVVSADLETLTSASPAAPAHSPRPALDPTVDHPPLVDAPAIIDLSRAQQVAAERLSASYRDAPHIQLRMEVAAHWLEQFRGGFAAEGKRISYNDLILRALALTLRQHPRLNSHFIDGQLHQLPGVDLGIATDTGTGLVVPVMRNVPSLSVEQIAQESRRLVDMARDGRLSVDEMTGGSFTVTNLGMFEISSFNAIINPPQVAILAVGAVERRVVPIDDQGAIGVRPMMTLNLAADHRAIDGAMGARFLQHLRNTLQSPALLA